MSSYHLHFTNEKSEGQNAVLPRDTKKERKTEVRALPLASPLCNILTCHVCLKRELRIPWDYVPGSPVSNDSNALSGTAAIYLPLYASYRAGIWLFHPLLNTRKECQYLLNDLWYLSKAFVCYEGHQPLSLQHNNVNVSSLVAKGFMSVASLLQSSLFSREQSTASASLQAVSPYAHAPVICWLSLILSLQKTGRRESLHYSF